MDIYWNDYVVHSLWDPSLSRLLPLQRQPLSYMYQHTLLFLSLPSHTSCRSLLQKLQQAFDTADSADMLRAVQLMESLKGHGKTVMWTKYHPKGSEETCGPVWDYEWPWLGDTNVDSIDSWDTEHLVLILRELVFLVSSLAKFHKLSTRSDITRNKSWNTLIMKSTKR